MTEDRNEPNELPLQRHVGKAVHRDDSQRVTGDLAKAAEAVLKAKIWQPPAAELAPLRQVLEGVFASNAELKRATELVQSFKLDTSAFSAPLAELASQVAQKHESLERWRSTLQGFDDALKNVRASAWLADMERAAARISAEQRELFQAFSVPGLDEFLRRLRIPRFDLEEFSRRERRAMATAGSMGWFVQPEAPASFGEYVLECDTDPSAFDALFIDLMTEVERDVEQRLVEAFPARGHIAAEAFQLHRENRYVASVPLFLLCADGISKARTGKSVFTKASKALTGHGQGVQIADHVRKHDIDAGMTACFEVLCSQHSLALHRPGQLNRHKVLHGEDPSYGSRENSFRAMSFLGFVGWLLDPSKNYLKPRVAK